jgi:hypothetical protein
MIRRRACQDSPGTEITGHVARYWNNINCFGISYTPRKEECPLMDIVFSKDSFHIYGKPAEVLEVLASLSATYATLGDLLESRQLNPGFHFHDKPSCKDTCSAGSKKKFRIFQDSPPHRSNINFVPLKPFDCGHSVLGDNDMPSV